MQLTPTLDSTEPIDPRTHVAELVTQDPTRAAVFERLGIDYCCGGKISLSNACAEHGLDIAEVTLMLERATAAAPPEPAWTTVSVEQLVTNIVDVHHAYLRGELPRIMLLAHKVARAHGTSNPNLVTAQQEVELMVDELRTHLAVEEDELFPICLEIARGDHTERTDAARLTGMMEHDHTQIASHLARLRELLDDYVPPTSACTTYRAYLDSLERLDHDIRRHVHKENHILFPKVMDSLYG